MWIYDIANKNGLTTKVHTGEQLGADYIKQCIIDFNPKQIQHGISIIQDKKVMKLKNSYVLLMVMAIFLLISVGSVCASEIADVEDVVSTDDGSEVVLANESSAPEKIDTKIVSDDNVRIEKGQDQKIPVTVNDNASKPISVSKENLKVSKGSEQLNFTYSNNEIKFTNLPKGNHSLLITYLGNDMYKNSTKNDV